MYANRILNILINTDYKNNFYHDNKLNSLINIIKELSPDLTDKINKLSTENEKQEFIKDNFSSLSCIFTQIKNCYRRYIESFGIKEEDIALFDIATANFSALKIIKNFLNKNIYAVYWTINSKACNTNTTYKTYQKNYINCIHNFNLLEFIITAPELPIKYIDKNGDFIRINNKEEVDRMNYYSVIYEQEINFSKDLLSTF